MTATSTAPRYPGQWARVSPDVPAIVMGGSGRTITYRGLADRSSRLAALLRARGLRRGDHLAVLMPNHERFLEVVWAGLQSGLYVTPVNRYLTGAEAAYIVADCGAQAIVVHCSLADVAGRVRDECPALRTKLVVDGDIEGYESYEQVVDPLPGAPWSDEEGIGDLFNYSSGTTGRPKGIARPLPERPIGKGPLVAQLIARMHGMASGSVYLSTAPLYHSAPLNYAVAMTALGGTAVVMESFEAEECLRLIEAQRVTHAQFVPTMFGRLLKLPENVRARYDLTSLQMVVHSAAPCPRPVKEQMFAWLGPIIHEYYGGSEGSGLTYAGPEEWLTHPGTVGQAIVGTVHICDEDGNELPDGEIGSVYFELPAPVFKYHNDSAHTLSVQHPLHPAWSRLGDLGRLDADGYLYLSDRESFMIISGGVNIYPKEVEDALVLHPKVADVAVIGVPDEDMGEAVKAVVQLVPGEVAGPDIEAELLAFVRGTLSHFKCPRSMAFVEELPRLPTGKLYKRVLRDPYWVTADTLTGMGK